MKRYLFRQLSVGVWVGSLLLLGAGCGTMAEMQAVGCRSDGDCATGLCNTQIGQCLAPVIGAPGLEVWPPAQNNQGWVVQEFPEGKLGDHGQVLVPLQPGVTVQGSVYASDSASLEQKFFIPARVVAWRDSLLPGRPEVQFETTATGSKADTPSAPGYVLWVNRGQTYNFYVTPSEPYDRQFPPLLKTGVRVDKDMPLEFVLDGSDRAVEVSGEVRIGESQPLPATLKVRVRAYKPGGLQRSTIAETEPGGHFMFKVPAGVDAYTVRVETAPGVIVINQQTQQTQPIPPIPTMECTGRTLGLLQTDLHRQDIGLLRLPTFVVPDPGQPFTISVKGRDGSPVANATVTFTTPLAVPPSQNASYEACTSWYSQTDTTDAEGKVKLLLLSGENNKNRTYSVTVVSPPASRFASQYVPSFEVGLSPGVLQAIELSPRYRVSGKVVDSTGQAVAGAGIEAQGIALGGTNPLPPGQQALPPGEATGTSDKDGAFELFMDPGIYNIDVRPPDGVGLPSIGLTAKEIGSNVEDVLFTMPVPQTLRGRVIVPGMDRDIEVPNAQVKFYQLVPGTESQRASLRARSITDAEGTFYLLLPPGATR